MIDIENNVFDYVASLLRQKYKKIFVVGEYIKSPALFPCVSIIEEDNQVYRNTSTSSNTENHARVLYEINIYSNKTNGKKTEAKNILATIDDHLHKLGFVRIMASPIPNESDNTIYRVVARYRATISKDKVIYRR